jgi:hypothetical protein
MFRNEYHLVNNDENGDGKCSAVLDIAREKGDTLA